MVTVFISYAREDLEAARRLYKDLLNARVEPWLDEECLLPGQRWKPAIREAITRSNYFLALISKNSTSKVGYVQKELREALDILDEFPESKIFVIPVRLDNCEPSHEKLKELHWVDMFPNWKDGLEKTLRAMGIKIIPVPQEPTRENDNADLSLQGYDRRVFLDVINKLNATYDRIGMVGNQLNEIGFRIDNFDIMTKATTSDGYYWFWALVFKTDRGKIAVLFPWSASLDINWGRPKGLRIDRSIEIFTEGIIDLNDVIMLVSKIYKALLIYRKDLRVYSATPGMSNQFYDPSANKILDENVWVFHSNGTYRAEVNVSGEILYLSGVYDGDHTGQGFIFSIEGNKDNSFDESLYMDDNFSFIEWRREGDTLKYYLAK